MSHGSHCLSGGPVAQGLLDIQSKLIQYVSAVDCIKLSGTDESLDLISTQTSILPCMFGCTKSVVWISSLGQQLRKRMALALCLGGTSSQLYTPRVIATVDLYDVEDHSSEWRALTTLIITNA